MLILMHYTAPPKAPILGQHIRHVELPEEIDSAKFSGLEGYSKIPF
jgi:hypothetical protein